jgi:signal transduction histidine kinase
VAPFPATFSYAMAYRDWLRPPRHLIALFLLLTLVPSLLLIAFGWRLLRQDLELERQQTDARREQAADVIVAALEQSVAAVEQAMRESRHGEYAESAGDAIGLAFSPRGVDAFPSHRLIFYPAAAPGPEAAAAVFAGGEAIEFRESDPSRAAAWFRDLARSTSPAVRAGAQIALARNLRKAGHAQAALDTYARISAVDAAVGGVPADLLAAWARCDLLAALGRTAELQSEARALGADLLRGRWRVDRAQFTMHLADAARWSGVALSPGPEAIALATSVESLYQQWRQTPAGRPFSGRAARSVDGSLYTTLWQGSADGATAFVAGPRYVEAQWRTRLSPLEERHAVRAGLSEPTARTSRAGVRPRSAAETGLPWTVIVEPAGPQAGAAFSGRRAIWLAGLGMIALLVASGTYVVVRAVSREFAVAQLQTDFVSAVSHEFRTPLTSLRQLSEMLVDRPEAPVDRRQAYYAALARQTDRLHRLVESLLDFGRMEAGTSPYRFAPIDAGALVAEIVRQFGADTAARGYDVRLQAPAHAVMISADRDAITNALWNLLDNAVKYSPASRVVWVDVSADPQAMFIRVRDRGLGIPAAEQRDIFGKFVRGATARAGNISGTGIGLAMVSHIVTAHRGSVTVESEPGAGSTFTIRLPVLQAAALPAREGVWLGS